MSYQLDPVASAGASSGTAAPAKASAAPPGGAWRRRGPLSTSTVTSDGWIVPWLAADGPLAYSPEEPPERDYFFQFGWVLPGIFAEHTDKRRHLVFGAYRKDDARELFSFWKRARDGKVEGVEGHGCHAVPWTRGRRNRE